MAADFKDCPHCGAAHAAFDRTHKCPMRRAAADLVQRPGIRLHVGSRTHRMPESARLAAVSVIRRALARDDTPWGLVASQSGSLDQKETPVEQSEEIVGEVRRRRTAPLDTTYTRLRNAVLDAVSELAAEHQPEWSSDAMKAKGKDPIGCVICWPKDGGWPCSTAMVVDDLRAALSGGTEQAGEDHRG